MKYKEGERQGIFEFYGWGMSNISYRWLSLAVAGYRWLSLPYQSKGSFLDIP
ncbi:MAG: hypothetical protein IJ727_00405 [Treponema sp.]|nr:hypothetical protein [Treponema sp.]